MRKNLLRKLVSEVINADSAGSKLQDDIGFLKDYKLVKSRVIDDAQTWKFEFKTDDNSYVSYAFFVMYPDGRCKMKLETDWKVTTKDNTSGAGRDFSMAYGPFDNYDEMVSELNRKLNNNPLVGPELYFDNNDQMLDREIVNLFKKIKEKIGEIRELNHPALNTLVQMYDAIKDIPDEELAKFSDENFKGWLLKQGVIYKMQDVDKLPYYKSLKGSQAQNKPFEQKI